MNGLHAIETPMDMSLFSKTAACIDAHVFRAEKYKMDFLPAVITAGYMVKKGTLFPSRPEVEKMPLLGVIYAPELKQL
jgi:hypothetical protein